MSLTVKANEHGLVRVFALSLTDAEATALKHNAREGDDNPTPQEVALGAASLDPGYVEVFPINDLADLGLVGYLETGNGIDPDQLAPDRQKLEALEGWILCVYSAAFSGHAQTLSPTAALTLIGTYSEPGVDWADTQTLTSDAARAARLPSKKRPSDAAMSGRIAMAALIFIFALTFLMVWIAG